MEMTITGINAITYPYLHIWDWRVAIYLFLGGLSGGMMSMSAIANLRPGKALPSDLPCSWRIPMLAPILISIGMFFLFLDLELKSHLYWFYLTLQPTSPMSWGAWILVLSYPPMILYAMAAVPEPIKGNMKPGVLKNLLDRCRPHLAVLARINFVGGIMLAIYTGILLSTFVARPLWNSSIIPLLFLVSGMSTSAALMIIVARVREVKLFFTKVDIWLILAEMMILLLFFYGQYTSDAIHRQSILPFLNVSDKFFPYFMSIVAINTFLPLALILKYLEVKNDHSEEISQSGWLLMNLSAVLVLLGGVVLRFALVYAGQLSSFSGLLR
jgi:protein NrfD